MRKRIIISLVLSFAISCLTLGTTGCSVRELENLSSLFGNLANRLDNDKDLDDIFDDFFDENVNSFNNLSNDLDNFFD